MTGKADHIAWAAEAVAALMAAFLITRNFASQALRTLQIF
jgi:hypothetical protein